MQAARRAMLENLLVHPRIAHQQLAPQEALQTLARALPELKPFRNQRVAGVYAILDWDHRIPSRSLSLRLHLSYTAATHLTIARDLDERRAEISARDLFPEFDVADFSGLPGDEIYEIELRPDLSIVECRLVSAWRREISAEEAAPAIAAVRRSQAFHKTRTAQRGRPAQLGDLEVVAWTPPCESGQSRWTLDVWWLTSFDGRNGRGWSFLVDLDAGPRPDDRVVAQREFSIRTS